MPVKFVSCLCILIALTLMVVPRQAGAVPLAHTPDSHAPVYGTTLGVQTFLDNQPGVLKNYTDGGQQAAIIIENNSLYYGLSPHLYLTLLETTSGLLSNPNPPEALLRQPLSPDGPDGFAAQIEWASLALRSGLGPHTTPPTLTFKDGVTTTLLLEQPPEAIAVQLLLATGRTSSEWQSLYTRFNQVLAHYFHAALPDLFTVPTLDAPSEPAPNEPDPTAPPGSTDNRAWLAPTEGFLYLPWPDGVRMTHLAYFDHVYPTVDSGSDGYASVVTYMGNASVQYDTHDGHDYYFPDQPVGTPILAAASGIAYARTARGNGVVILHSNGFETVYWHLDEFAPRFSGLIDSNQGIPVEAGDTLGTSGSTGFVYGSPHLHFEVRRYGRQVDPYGWYGPGPDPCAEYAGCEPSTWLWHKSLIGHYDFTPPGASLSPNTQAAAPPPLPPADPNAYAQPTAAPATPSDGTDDYARDGNPSRFFPPDHDGAAAQDQPLLPTLPPATPRQPTPPATSDQSQQQAPDSPAPPVTSDQVEQQAPVVPTPLSSLQATDQAPPVGTLSVNPPEDVLLYVPFDGHVVQQVGHGFAAAEEQIEFLEGRYGQGIRLPVWGGLSYPISDNLHTAEGSISVWAYVPEAYPPNSINRHYIFAASANASDTTGVYAGTLALRRDMVGPDGNPGWNFWTTPQTGESERNDLFAPDSLASGWHHFAITWNMNQRSKALYLDGALAASADNVTLPSDVGALLQLGRFTTGSRQSGLLFDELAIFARVLTPAEIAALAQATAPIAVSATTVQTRTLLLDTNASDAESGIDSVQLGREGTFIDPLPYHDGYTWRLPSYEGAHNLEVRYFDKAGNHSVVTHTVILDLSAPQGNAAFQSINAITATLSISATDRQPPISMQVSTDQSFAQAEWMPLETVMEWAWQPPLTDSTDIPTLYVRFQDATGLISEPVLVADPNRQLFLPMIVQADRASVSTPVPSTEISPLFLPMVMR